MTRQLTFTEDNEHSVVMKLELMPAEVRKVIRRRNIRPGNLLFNKWHDWRAYDDFSVGRDDRDGCWWFMMEIPKPYDELDGTKSANFTNDPTWWVEHAHYIRQLIA